MYVSMGRSVADVQTECDMCYDMCKQTVIPNSSASLLYTASCIDLHLAGK